MTVLSTYEIEKLLGEDVPYGDLTSEALGLGDARGNILFTARAAMTVAAIEEAQAVLALAGVDVRREVVSGQVVEAGVPLLTGHGAATAVLRAWKVAQTLVEVWSGVASATRRLVRAAQAARPEVVIACTRKNVPGTKALAVAAVRAGGGAMHRLGLSETVLVFPEHRVFRVEDPATLARALNARLPEKKLVIEVNSVAEGVTAAVAGFDVIQTEKFAPAAVAQLAAELARLSPRPRLAAAGGINPDNVADYARAGADVLVTSWPYVAPPSDVAVTITRA